MRINPQYRYLVNINPDRLEVHDLDDERNGCQINEIANFDYIDGNSELDLQKFLTDNPEYDGCRWCLERYHRK